MSKLTARLFDQEVTLEYSTVQPLPYAPEVKLTSTEQLQVSLNKISSEARVLIPAGDYYAAGNTQGGNHYTIYAPKVLGTVGAGRGASGTRIRLVPNSWLNKTTFPVAAGEAYRFGPNGGTSGKQIVVADLDFIGADQAAADGVTPMNRDGFVTYWGRGAIMRNVGFFGMGRGSGNSPKTGETFTVKDQRAVDSLYEDVEIDQRDPVTGKMIGASPIGANGSTNITLRRVYAHDSLYSGPTFSIAGNRDSPTRKVTIEDCRFENNANHKDQGSGSRFAGINFEYVEEAIRISGTRIILDQASLWDSNHVSIGDTKQDNPDVVIKDMDWGGLGPAKHNGCFTVMAWGKQTTAPTVVMGGKTLEPFISSGNPASMLPVDPTKHYVFRVNKEYLAP